MSVASPQVMEEVDLAQLKYFQIRVTSEGVAESCAMYVCACYRRWGQLCHLTDTSTFFRSFSR